VFSYYGRDKVAVRFPKDARGWRKTILADKEKGELTASLPLESWFRTAGMEPMG
jgi:hypothetical protein